MLVYRITHKKFADDLTGVGARFFGGRWNSAGLSLLYTASTRALAVLEILVHTTHNFIPDDFEIVTIEIPDTICKEEITQQNIFSEIKEFGITAKFNAIGDKWIKSNASLLLIVPSVVVPEEKNILVNPLHPDFKKVKIAEKKKFNFDQRLLGK